MTDKMRARSRRTFFRPGTILGVVAWLPTILFLDSQYMAARISWGQWAANIATFMYFGWMYYTASARLRKLMIIGLFVATAGEVFFALIVGMYEYRLENIPLYVPPGHTIVYGAVYYFAREPWVRRHRRPLAVAMFIAAAGFSTWWLFSQNDLYGFICFSVFCTILLVNRDSTMFFLSMYLLVLYLELLGTSMGNWYWHSILLDKYPSIPSGNPPSGISVFYFGFDVACLGFYMLSDLKRRARYDAQKAYRKRLKRQRQGTTLPQARIE